ncbi:MAG: hypothetical protein ACOCUK_01785, partial [bacterium]
MDEQERQRRFNNIQKQARKQFLELQQEIEQNYEEINERLKRRIQRIVMNYSNADGEFNSSDLPRIREEIDGLSYWFENELTDFLEDNMDESAGIAIKGQDEAAQFYVESLMEEVRSQDRSLLRQALRDEDGGVLLQVRYGDGLISSVRDELWQRRWDDGFNLSDRIWKMRKTMDENFKNIVEQSVNQGKSAVDFAKAAEDYLEVPGPRWRTDIKPGLQVGDKITRSDGVTYTVKQPRATVKYNALRLARTETNQAYQRAQKTGDKESDIVKGTKWNLSNSHPTSWPPSAAHEGYPEICDYRAKA